MDQDPDTDFVRAGAVEMHLDMSQEPLDAEIYRSNAADQLWTKTATQTLCQPAQSKCTCTRATLYRNLQVKCPMTMNSVTSDEQNSVTSDGINSVTSERLTACTLPA